MGRHAKICGATRYVANIQPISHPTYVKLTSHQILPSLFSSSFPHLSASSVPAWIMTCQCVQLPPSQLSSSFWPYPVSPCLTISALVCLDFPFHLLSSRFRQVCLHNGLPPQFRSSHSLLFIPKFKSNIDLFLLQHQLCWNSLTHSLNTRGQQILY